MARQTDTLYSTVKNVSGSSKRLMFLPPHGRTLADQEEVTFLGDPVQAILAKRSNSVAAKRELAALEAALQDGTVEIIKTPAPVLYDATADVSKQLKLDDSVLYVAAPSWLEQAASSSIGP